MRVDKFETALGACRQQDCSSYRPILFDAGAAQDRERLLDLIEACPDLWVIDALESQLRDLARADAKRKDLEAELIEASVRELVNHQPLSRWGQWVYYPWARKVVHTLPCAQFRRLRFDRNHHKITIAEQRDLASKTIAVVGLSVGRSALLDLVQEGVGGTYRICDYDLLDVSNLNRLRGSVADVGINKAILAAREAYEQDPYIDVEVFPDGVNAQNLDRILDGSVDLLVEECDDLAMKVRLRERARALGIPVVMDTSDRGMLDVERYDLDPERPILHGLIPDVDAATLEGLSNKERIPFALAILNAAELSTRMAGSLAEIEESIYTWPQLASGVALGGALVCDTARRILLNSMRASGRFYVDLTDLIQDGRQTELPTPVQAAGAVAEAAREPREIAEVGGDALHDPRRVAEYLVAHAQWAPSGGNTQPWRFRADGMTLDCLRDEERADSFLDFDGRGHQLAIGAAVENIVIAASHLGLRAEVRELHDGPLIARVRLHRADIQASPRRAAITHRVTNRRLDGRLELDDGKARELLRSASAAGLVMRIDRSAPARRAWGEALGEIDRLRGLIKPYHDELFSEVRWNADEVMRTRTGIDVQSLEMSASDVAGMRVLERWGVADFLRTESLGGALRTTARKAFAACGGVGVFSAPSSISFFEAGRRLQRVWLDATALKLAFQPWAPVLGMMPRAQQMEGLNHGEALAIREQVERVLGLWKAPASHYPLFLVRIHQGASQPSARSLRLPLSQVLTFS